MGSVLFGLGFDLTDDLNPSSVSCVQPLFSLSTLYINLHLLFSCWLPPTHSLCCLYMSEYKYLAIDNNPLHIFHNFCMSYCFDRNQISKIFLRHISLFSVGVLCRLYAATFVVPHGLDFWSFCAHASLYSVLFQSPQSEYIHHAIHHLVCRYNPEYNFL